MKRVAFIRCWNEENTVIASLMSIENIFSHFVIIHSDITDNSLKKIETTQEEEAISSLRNILTMFILPTMEYIKRKIIIF